LKALTRQALQGKCWHNMAVMSMHHYQQAHAKSTCRVRRALAGLRAPAILSFSVAHTQGSTTDAPCTRLWSADTISELTARLNVGHCASDATASGCTSCMRLG